MFYKTKTNEFQESLVGKIPKDWQVQNLGNIALTVTDFVANGAFASLRANVKYSREEEYAILLRVCDNSNNFQGPFVYISESAYNFLSKSRLNPKDIVLGNVGAVGTVFRVPNLQKPMSLGPNAILVKTGEYDDYFYYWTKSTPGQKALQDITTKTAQPKFNKTDLKTVKIALPPAKEQKKITELLLTVDSVIELADQVIAKTERLKRGLMQQLLTNGIGHKEYKQTPIGKIPSDWIPTKIGDIAKLQSGGTPRRDVKEYWTNGKIPWLKSGELNDGEVCEAEERINQQGLENSAAKIFPKGTLLMAMYGKGTVTKTGILAIEAATNQAVCAFIPKDSQFNPKFLQYYLIFKRNQLLGQLTNPSTDMGRTNIYSGMLASYQIPLPSKIEEQNRIAEIIQETDVKLQLEQQEKAKLQNIKSGLMDLLLTGKVRIKVD